MHGARVGRRLELARRPRPHDLQHLGHAASVLGGDGQRIAQAQTVEIGEPRLLGRRLHLVGHEEHERMRLAEQGGNLQVEPRHTLAHVHDEEHDVGFLEGGQHLTAHALDQWLGRRRIEAAGVDDGGVPALEGDAPIEPVAGDTGDVVHQRLPSAHEPIEERGLADVGTADHGHEAGVEPAGLFLQ